MKKIYISIMLTLTILSLSSCVDFYARQRPSDYPETKWESQSPNIYFEVTSNPQIIYGKLVINGIENKIIVDFDHGNEIIFRDISAYISPGGVLLSEWLFKGSCKFSKDKLVVKITDNRDFLDESIKTITFVREDLPEN